MKNILLIIVVIAGIMLNEACKKSQDVIRDNVVPTGVGSYPVSINALVDMATNRNLGTVNLTQGRLDDAIACFRRALQLNPNYADACNNLAVALQTQGKFEEALVSYHQTMGMKIRRNISNP